MADEKEEEPYRCKETVDLEDLIAMKNQEDFENIRATVIYKSGRTETFTGKLKKDQTPKADFQKKVHDLKRFPSVVKIETERF